MIMQLLKKQKRHILIDIDTQKDFLSEGRDVCIMNRRKVLANIRRMMAWARFKNIPVISTAEVFYNHGECTTGHCLDGTEGQRKIPYTLLNDRVSFPADGWNTLPGDVLRVHQQVILHKRCRDPFEEPRIERLLSELEANEFVLIGIDAENAVMATALGLLQRGKNVRIVVDALGFLNANQARLDVRKMAAKGTKLSHTRDMAGISHLKYAETFDRRNCLMMIRKKSAEIISRPNAYPKIVQNCIINPTSYRV
jgi:nicotinamidase-related amidase